MNVSRLTRLFDETGAFVGVFLPQQLWDQLDEKSRLALEQKHPPVRPIAEPLEDWETLKKIWDFPYAVDTDVHCTLCGNITDDWEHDEPRKFHLKAASIGGLVSFECIQCRARIRKNHFKDAIDVACTPYMP